MATLAKFWVASLALDASVVAAGGSLSLSGDVIDLIEPTSMGEQLDEKRLYCQNGPCLTDQEALAALEFHAHHFNCARCVGAGRGTHYGERCAVGATLWDAYA